MVKRNNLIPVRTDDDELAYVDQRADRDGTSRSAFIRKLIRDERRRELQRAKRIVEAA